MRTFLALLPDRDTALRIDGWRARHWPGAGRDVPVQNLHVTLCFLGDVDARRLERVSLALDETVLEPLALDVELDAPGFHVESGVTWLAPSAPPPALHALGKRMRGIANRAGIRVDGRTFRPHVTLARRVDHPPPAPLSTPRIVTRFERVTLVESRLDPRGVRYRDLGSWPP